jgi:hypothetical protein
VANFTANYDEITISNSPVLIVLDNSFEMTNFLHPCITSLCETMSKIGVFLIAEKNTRKAFRLINFVKKIDQIYRLVFKKKTGFKDNKYEI